MISLTDAIERASVLAASGDPEEAARVLGDAAPAIDAEQERDLLLLYAESCHNWGPPEAEEAALRAVIRQGPHLDALECLLDLLQQKLNTVRGESRAAVISECERLGTEALLLLHETDTLRWSNLVHPRGLRRLELAQLGHRDRVQGARADLEAHRRWLERNESVPPHLRRTNLMALVDVDLAELDLVEDRCEDAVRRLEAAIAALESAKAPQWWIERAYAVLERAYG